MRKLLLALVAGCSLTTVMSAGATPVTFDLAGAPNSYVDVDADCLGWCGVTAQINGNLDNLQSTLSAGDSWTFDFFSLNFSGVGLGLGTIEAYLAFDLPLGAPGAGGSGVGVFATGFLGTAGGLIWDQPDVLSLSDGTSYLVQFSNLLGFTSGWTASVEATLTLLKEPGAVTVPEPATLSLLGLGLLGVGFMGRRKKARLG